MAYDGSILLDTKIDTKGIEAGLRGVTSLVAAGAAAASAAVVGLGVAVGKIGMEFQSGLSGIQAVSGATQAEMKALTAAAVQAGEDTAYSAAESAKAIEELIKAGLSVEQVLGGGLAGALELAAAGEIGLADAAEIASTALNAFRDDNLSVSEAANILAGAANASATDIMGLKLGLSQAAAVASGVGMNFEDTATALAVFAQNGLKGSDAGTSLKTTLQNLQPETDKQWAAFKMLGLVTEETGNAFFDAAGNIRPLNEIAGVLADSMSHLTNEQRNYIMGTMFGTDAIRAANILYKEGAEGIDNMAAAMSKIEAADVAAARLDNLSGDVEYLTGSLETLGISVYQNLDESLRKATQEANKHLDDMADAFKTDEMQEAIEDVGDAFVDFAGDTSKFVAQNVPKLVQGFATVAKHGEALVEVALAVTAGIAGFKVASTVIPVIKGLSAAYAASTTTLAGYSSASAIANGVDAVAAITAGVKSGALSAQDAVVAALTVKMGLAARAQMLWDAAIAASPIGTWAVVIGTAIGAIALLALNMEDTTTEADEFSASVDKLAAKNKALAESVEQSASAYESNIDNIEAQGLAADGLIDRITELSAKENKSAGEKLRLKSYVDMLNKSVDGLNLQYDEQNDTLSMNAEQIKAVTDAQKERLSQQAREERALELAKEHAAAELAVADAQAKREEAAIKLAEAEERYSSALVTNIEGADGMSQAVTNTANEVNAYRQALEDATAAEEAAATTKEQTSAAFESASAAIEESNAAIAESEQALTETIIGENGERFANIEEYQAYLKEQAEAEKELLKAKEAAYEEYSEFTTNAFSKATEGSKISLDQMITNLQANQTQFETWSTAIKELTELGLHEGLIDQLVAAGPEAAGQAAKLVEDIKGASDTKLQELNTLYETGIATAQKTVGEQFGDPEWVKSATDTLESIGKAVTENEKVQTAFVETVEETKTATDTAVRNANFAQVGLDMMAGVAQGIRNGTSEVVSAATSAALAAYNAAKDALEIRSPSKKFEYLADMSVGAFTGRLEDAKAEVRRSSAGLMQEAYASAALQQARFASSSGMTYHNAPAAVGGGDTIIEKIVVEGAPINSNLDAQKIGRILGEAAIAELRSRGVTTL